MGSRDEGRSEDRVLDLTTCAHCGTENVGDSGYCGFCGESLPGPPLLVDSPATVAEMPAPHFVHPEEASELLPGMGDVRDEMTKSDATRYICAAVHTSWRLRERIVREVINEVYKAPPRSPDVDLVTVVAHTIAARRRRAVCDLLLTLLCVAGLFLFLLLDAPLVPGLVAFIGVAWLIGFIGRLVALYGTTAQSLRPHGYNLVARQIFKGSLRTRLSSLEKAVQGNITVYGGYSPFLGSGTTRESWSFPLDILRGAEGKVAQPFNAQDIHDFVLGEVRAVGLTRVGVEDRVFVDGRDLVGDGRFIQHQLSPPSLNVPADMVRSLRIQPEDKVRPYACFYVKGWGGQLVSSTYLRFVVTRRHLFVEATSCLLPPIKEKYQKIDRATSRPRFSETVQIGAAEILLTPFRLLLAPWLLLFFMARPLNQFWHTWKQRREITRERAFNYGTVFSPREVLADRKFQRYFQQLDSDQYTKIVEKNIFQSLVDFLDDHGIDTGELVERQTTILNNGVYVTEGATVNATNLAAGTKAKATNAIGGTGARKARASV
jgi:hypothetical protein